jgi:phosphoglucosamine mutase
MMKLPMPPKPLDAARDLFGTDGVRGLAGQYPLDTPGATSIGAAVGTYFAKPGQTIIIGCDTRQSSTKLVADLVAGLTKVGVQVTQVGVITTPGLAYITREGSYVAGVMVTASHNPFTYNGVKVFDGQGGKLDDTTEAALNNLIVSGVVDRPGGDLTRDSQLTNKYIDFLMHSVEGLDLTGLRIAVDMANGSASAIASTVFTKLGASVTPLFDAPNGTNINDGCGATNTTVLQQTVLNNKLDLGIAFDGDADRLMLVDNLGRECNGDHILYLLAVAEGAQGVVATVMSNLGLEQAPERNGIQLSRAQVGDRYVLEGLRATGYSLGGEQSGHIIFPDLLMTGDGLLAAVQVLHVLHGANITLAGWRDEVIMLPQALVNIAVSDKALLKSPAVQAFITSETASLGSNGRLLIRPSGTEPLVRVMVEANDAQAIAEHIAVQLQELLG